MSDATKIPQDLCPACKQPVNVPSGGWHEGRFYTEGVKHPMYSTGKPEISDDRLREVAISIGTMWAFNQQALQRHDFSEVVNYVTLMPKLGAQAEADVQKAIAILRALIDEVR